MTDVRHDVVYKSIMWCREYLRELESSTQYSCSTVVVGMGQGVGGRWRALAAVGGALALSKLYTHAGRARERILLQMYVLVSAMLV